MIKQSAFLDQVFDDECVFDHRGPGCAVAPRASASPGHRTLMCATSIANTRACEVVPVAPRQTLYFLTRLPTAAPPQPHPHLTLPPHHACENLLLGALFNGEALVWEKVAKSWEKGALSRRGREGVNHERTCL